MAAYPANLFFLLELCTCATLSASFHYMTDSPDQVSFRFSFHGSCWWFSFVFFSFLLRWLITFLFLFPLAAGAASLPSLLLEFFFPVIIVYPFSRVFSLTPCSQKTPFYQNGKIEIANQAERNEIIFIIFLQAGGNFCTSGKHRKGVLPVGTSRAYLTQGYAHKRYVFHLGCL